MYLLMVAYLHLASIVFLFVKELDFSVVQNEPNRHTYLSINMQEYGPRVPVFLEALKVSILLRTSAKRLLYVNEDDRVIATMDLWSAP
jgi:hypothetical protein